MNRITRVGLFSLVAVAFVAAGCASTQRDAANSRVYPESLPRGEVLDIQAFRDGSHLRATNTSTRSFGPSTMWINKRFGQPIAGWASGQTITLDLNAFYDEFGEEFRGGGFFARETPEDVVLVQIETDGESGKELVGIIAIGSESSK
jgi:hypothetical protein